MATEVSENEILQCLLKSIEESFPINFDEQKIELGKSLEGMPGKQKIIRRKVGKMMRQLKRQVREAFNLKMKAI